MVELSICLTAVMSLHIPPWDTLPDGQTFQRISRFPSTVQSSMSYAFIISSVRLTNDQLTAAIDFIHDHIGESLGLDSISRAAGLSEFHFARLFKAATGETPFQFVTRIRMERAKQLLCKTRLPIFEVTGRVGYGKASHFSARFSCDFGKWSGRLPQVHWTLKGGLVHPRSSRERWVPRL